VRKAERVSLLLLTVCLGGTSSDGSARVAPSVVYLESHSPIAGTPIGSSPSGTGFVIASDNEASYVMTAAHVLKCDTYGAGCVTSIDVRLQNDTMPIASRPVYAGASSPTDDVAIVRVPRASLTPVELGDAAAAESVGALGFPDTLIARLNGERNSAPVSLLPVPRIGSVTSVVEGGQRLIMRIATTHGDSGAPIFDASSGAVVGLVHGASGDAPDADRYAIGPLKLRARTMMVLHAIAAAHGDAGVAAHLLYLNAAAAAARYNFLFLNSVGFLSEPMRALEQTQRQLFIEAIDAGSVEAAEYVVTSPFQDTIMITRNGVPDTLDAAASRGDSDAALALGRYFARQTTTSSTNSALPRSAQPEKDALHYLQMAADLGNGYAMNDLANVYTLGLYGARKDAGAAVGWRKRADTAFEQRARDSGDGAAMLARAKNYEYFEGGGTLQNRPQLLDYLRRADDLGAPDAMANWGVLSFDPPALLAEEFSRLKADVAAGSSGAVAEHLGEMYEHGYGTTADVDNAITAYAHSANFAQHLTALVPNGTKISASLTASNGYRVAAASSARIEVPSSGPLPTTWIEHGVVVWSDGHRAIVATSAFNLECDSFGGKCAVPTSVEIGPSPTKYRGVRIVRYADTSVENGVVLLAVDAPNAIAAPLADTPPRIAMSAGYFSNTSRVGADGSWLLGTPAWGIITAVSADGRVIDLAMRPEFLIGSGIFDVSTGRLVGIYTDPYNVLHATGPATIATALREVQR
jgi:TPR repeat protein